MTNDLDIARDLILAGVPVFVASQDEEPGTFKLPLRWQQTVPDVSVLDQWYPGKALCAVTGVVVDVVDIDPRNGGDMAIAEDIRHPLGTVLTPNGGSHTYIRRLGIPKTTFLPGVDLQAGTREGKGRGFVFLPPTERTNIKTGELRPYQWLRLPPVMAVDDTLDWPKEQWILDIIRAKKKPKPERKRVVRTDDEKLRRYASKGLANLLRDYVMAVPGTGERAAVGGIRRTLEMVNAGWIDYDDVAEAWEAAREEREDRHPQGGGQSADDWERIWGYQVQHVGDAEANPPSAPKESANLTNSARLLRGLAPIEGSDDDDPKGLEHDGKRLSVQSAADIQPSNPTWLWGSRIPIGGLSLLGGREGIGKSTIAYDLIASITRGKLPGQFRGTPKNCVVIATEDSWEYTIVPRLIAARAELSRVFKVAARDVLEGEPVFPRDIQELQEICVQRDVKLILLDPLMSRLDGKLDTHKDADARRGLEPLVKVAEMCDAAVLGLIHVNKGGSQDPLTSLMGSRAFAAVARAVLFTQVEQGSDDRYLSLAKCNVGPVDGIKSLRFSIKTWHGTDKTGRKPLTSSKIVWEDEDSRSARDIMRDSHTAEQANKPSLKNDIRKWILGMNDKAVLYSNELQKEAEQMGWNWRTVRRVLGDLGMEFKKHHEAGKSFWTSPDRA